MSEAILQGNVLALRTYVPFDPQSLNPGCKLLLLWNNKKLETTKSQSGRNWQNKMIHPCNSGDHWKYLYCKPRSLDFFPPCNNSSLENSELDKMSKIPLVFLEHGSTWL